MNDPLKIRLPFLEGTVELTVNEGEDYLAELNTVQAANLGRELVYAIRLRRISERVSE